jgi:hypothetical protein
MKVWRGRCRDRIRKCLIVLDGIANSGTWCVVLLASALEVLKLALCQCLDFPLGIGRRWPCRSPCAAALAWHGPIL